MSRLKAPCASLTAAMTYHLIHESLALAARSVYLSSFWLVPLFPSLAKFSLVGVQSDVFPALA